MKLKFDRNAYLDPAYNIDSGGIDSDLDLSARAASPSRKAVTAQIGGVKTSIWKRAKKAKK